MTLFDGIFPQLAAQLVSPSLAGIPAVYTAPDTEADEPGDDGESTRAAGTPQSILCTPPAEMSVEEARRAGVDLDSATDVPVRVWSAIVPTSSISGPPVAGGYITANGQTHRIVGKPLVLGTGALVAAYQVHLVSTGEAP